MNIVGRFKDCVRRQLNKRGRETSLSIGPIIKSNVKTISDKLCSVYFEDTHYPLKNILFQFVKVETSAQLSQVRKWLRFGKIIAERAKILNICLLK